MAKWKRNLIKFTILFLVMALLIVASLPIWLPWIITLASGSFNLQFRTYQRDGWNRITLRGLKYQHGSVLVQVDRVVSPLPYYWWRSSWENRFVEVDGWAVTISPRQAVNGGEKQIQSVWEFMNLLEDLERQLWKWLPRAELRQGEVRIKERVIGIPRISWNNRVISASLLSKPLREPVHLRAGKSGPGQWEINAGWRDFDSHWQLRSTSAGIQGEGRLAQSGNTAQATFSFDQKGWLPVSGRVEADQLALPISWLSQQGYQPLHGKVVGLWDGKELKVGVEARAQPQAAHPELISLILGVAGTVDQSGVRLDTATLHSAGIDFRLMERATLSFQRPYLTQPATLIFKADLSRLPWPDLAGEVGGHVEVRPGLVDYPVIQLKTGGRIGYQGLIQFQQFDLSARMDWPWVELENLTLVTTNQAEGLFSGRYNLVQGRVENGRLTWNGIPESKWIPERFRLKDIELTALVEGPAQNLLHQGSIKVARLRIRDFPPMDARMDWKGAAGLLSAFQAHAEWDDSQIRWQGQGGWSSGKIIWTNSVLNLTRADTTILGLEKPAVVEWDRAPDRSAWTLTIAPMEFGGSGGEARISSQLDWPRKGAIDLSILNLRLQEVQSNLPPIQFDLIRAQGDWDNAPLVFQLELNGLYQPKSKKAPFRALMEAEGDAKGIRVERVEVLQGAERAVSGRAALPVRLGPGYKNWMEAEESGRVDIQVQSFPQAGLWQQLEDQSGLVIRNPDVKLSVAGTLRLPEAQLTAQVDELRQAKPDTKLPVVSQVNTEVRLDGQQLELTRLHFLVDGQPVQASGEVPWEMGEPWREQLSKAQGRLQIAKADLTPILQPWTNLFRPQGQLSLNLVMEPGLKWQGKVEVRGLESRPLATMGPIQDIYLVGNVEGMKTIFPEGGATIGGDSVQVNGMVDWSHRVDGLPLFDLRIQSREVPLARRPDLILRSGFDLAVRHETNQPVTVSGLVILTNSVYLSDLELLIPGKVAAPDRRPPYFSITNRPVADWVLNVEIQGNRFIRIRSPIFRGEAGLQAQLRGTLQEPILLGQVTIPSGFIQFPFGNLEVRQGLVSLTSENPYQPQIDLRASSRVFGYEVQITAQGSIQEPILEFSAIPGLSSEQVVLMLTAGELPQQDVRFTGRQKATHLGLFLGRNLLSQFSEDANVADRLTVHSGQDVSAEGHQTYLVEYQWRENWSLVAEYDRFGEYNGGVKWRFYSR